jgi:DNA repair exonuclease SbcCD ATPase subunit
MPTKPRIRIKFNETSAADMKRLIATIRKKYNVQDITIQRTITSTDNNSATSISIGNVRDVEYQNTLLTDYIDINFPQATAQELDTVRHINRTINSKLPAVESIRHTTWHPISFEFENMFSYGEGNVINFENLSDVCGLFAANTSGKSSLLDAITYTIFDKCSKTGKANEVLNNKKTTFKGVFKFEMNGIQYTIERRGTKKKEKHVKVDVDFYTDTENLNGEERSDTNKSIRRYLGTYDDFILTAFSLQADNNNFIEKSQKERKDLLSQFLDITVFEQLYQLAADEIKETSGRLKEYKKTDFAEIIIQSDDIITKNQNKIQKLEQSEDTLQETRNTLQEKIVSLIETKLPTTYDGPNIKALIKIEQDLENLIEQLQQDIEVSETGIGSISATISSARTNISKINIKVVTDKLQQLHKLQEQQRNLLLQITSQQGICNAKQQKINHLNTHEYDPNCKYCSSNIFVQDAIEAQSTIDSDRETLNSLQETATDYASKILALTVHIATNQTYNELTANIATNINLRERAELQQQILESDLQTRESELETCLERQELFSKNETAIKHNETVDGLIDTCKSEIITCTTDIKAIQEQIKNMYGAIEVAKTHKSTA